MSHNTMAELNPESDLKTTSVPTILKMAEDASMYRVGNGTWFRIDWVDRDAEGFHLVQEDSNISTFQPACDVPDDARFYNLVELNEQDYED